MGFFSGRISEGILCAPARPAAAFRGLPALRPPFIYLLYKSSQPSLIRFLSPSPLGTMRSFKGVNFGTLLSSPKEAEELLPDLKVGVLAGCGYIHLASQAALFVF